jgi:hypothetical protein
MGLPAPQVCLLAFYFLAQLRLGGEFFYVFVPSLVALGCLCCNSNNHTDEHPHPAQVTGPSINTTILGAEKNSKVKRQIEKQTQMRILPVLRNFATVQNVRVCATGLPFTLAKVRLRS